MLHFHLTPILAITTLLGIVSSFGTTSSGSQTRPNIVVILADDMGIDSVAALNDQNNIATPHLDTLVKEGIHFSDAHSASSVCSPSRYALLTGRYAWRSRLKRGIVKQWERPLIEKERLTLPGLLKKAGYHTACIGKWHLGWNWPKKGGGFTNKLQQIDFNQKIEGGPTSQGFDEYLGDDVPNWQPFAWIKNGVMQGVPDQQLTFAPHYHSGKGIGTKGWKLEDVLPAITKEAVDFIHRESKKEPPFFLYFSLTSPHTPIAPSASFLGKSGISPYADFLMETDWCVGQVMKALKTTGVEDNTLIIFTADNGTSPKCNFKELLKKNTNLQNHWRGMKADGFEGGHRVPFIVRWPKHIRANTSSNQIISLVDIMATCAAVAGETLPDTSAEDSVSLLPVITGVSEKSIKRPLHNAVICHSISGVFVVRKGKWKLQYSAGSGGWSQPSDNAALKKGLPDWQLIDLSKDPKETHNVIHQHPEVVKELTSILKNAVETGRSTLGAPQKNHAGAQWWPGLPWKGSR